MDVSKKIDELGSAVEAFKKANDERLAAIEKKGHADPVLTEKVDKANEAITKLQSELEQTKTAMNRTAQAIESKDAKNTGDSKEYKAAFQAAIRKGATIQDAVLPTEMKSLSADSNPDGGFLVRPELASKIVQKVFESTPMRQLADTQTIGTDYLEIIQDLNEASAGWTSERGSRTSTGTPQLNFAKIPTQELYAMPVATQKMLDDAIFDIESWLAAKVSDKFGRVEATAFVTGTGVGQPRGFLTYASGTSYGQLEQVASGSSANVTADFLIGMLYSLKAPYAQNATWLMQRSTAAAVRKLKDSQNRYIWEPNFQTGQPEMLLGRPLMWANDMAAMGANSLSVAVGDFKKGYQIVDRAGIRILRDPFTSKPNVQFYTTKRVGGDVVDFDAIKIGKLG